MKTRQKKQLTNQQVGELIGRSTALVSMMRLGKRLPGMDTMLAIEEGIGWPMQDQARAARDDKFADELNERLAAMKP